MRKRIGVKVVKVTAKGEIDGSSQKLEENEEEGRKQLTERYKMKDNM